MRQLENTLKIKDSSFIYTPEGMYFSERLAYNKLNFLELYTYDDINHFCDTIIK